MLLKEELLEELKNFQGPYGCGSYKLSCGICIGPQGPQGCLERQIANQLILDSEGYNIGSQG